MSDFLPHPWELVPEDAMILQSSLRESLALTWDGRPVMSIGGVDVGFADGQACAAIVVLRYPAMTLQTTVTALGKFTFPYFPGLLAFREGPLVLAAWRKLSLKPDLLMFDGQGIAHPRGFGIASHLGLWVQTPAIGVAKSRLYGFHHEVGPFVGDQSELRDERNPDCTIGAVVRTRENSRPLFVSPGHWIDLENAVRFVLACCRGYRLPEPIRLAHQLSIGGSILSDLDWKVSDCSGRVLASQKGGADETKN